MNVWALSSSFFLFGAPTPNEPPRSPKLNGHVERMQRTFRDEFYTRPLPSQIPELQRELDAYLDHYNRRRPHRALGGLAPLEYLARIRGEAVPTESQMCCYRDLTNNSGCLIHFSG